VNSRLDGQTERHCREVRFASDVYSLDAIKKAAYRFSDRCALDLRNENGTYVAVLLFSQDLSDDERSALERDFRNEVLDYDLRETIAAETAHVRNAVLAYAFSRTGLQGGDTI
jgi:His-Xaa-Ser system protein HxsD